MDLQSKTSVAIFVRDILRMSRFDFSASRIERSVKESMERLNVSYLDVVQCHDIEFGDLNQIVEESLPVLESLKSKGIVRR